MLNWISPMLPRVFTLLRTRFKPPTSCASVCISPSPFCTLSSCSVTSRNDWPIRSFSVFCNFSSTVRRISSNRFSVLATNRRCCSSKLANFSRCKALKEVIPRRKHSGIRSWSASVLPGYPWRRCAFFPVQTKIFPKVFFNTFK